MGSDFSKQICCVTCGRCKKQEAEEANEETSETKPILQTSGETSICVDTQPSTPVLEVSKQGSEEVQSLSQHRWPSADAADENAETCSAADPMGMTEGWEAAWDSTDFLAAPADGETKGEVKFLSQVDNEQEREKVVNAEEKIKPVPRASEAQPVTHTAQDAKLVADEEQSEEQAEAGSEGSPCAGITLQRNILNFIESTSETAAGQDCEIKPPAETGESPIGRNLPLHAVQMAKETETYLSAEHLDETDGAKLAEVSPRSIKRAELTSLVEAASLLTVQATQRARETADPSEVIANGMAETYSTSAMPWESLYPEGEPLEPANQLLDLEQETQSTMPTAQEMESLCCAEPAELSEVLCQSSDGVLGELEDEESRERDAETAASEAEPQHRIMQQTTELPEEPLTCVQIPIKQEAEFLNVAPSLPEVLGSSGEIEAENVEA
ncbi:retinitis pigmentosa 1-like 1 protein [Gymnogyps californianus]|uniref:retinitis pigmentosa 1-like 1 protein n=1 Tax=Gymnogyps californianus TaxID=33616 RepID=UPI0021CA9916|nr:retinitis pigmentosa 1-like 1 protein [Gymnogyps californianus]